MLWRRARHRRQEVITVHTNALRRFSLVGLLLFVFATAAAVQPPAVGPQPEDLANATYHGLQDAESPVTLSGGKWRGEPWVEGGAAAPTAWMLGGLFVEGDLDRDGHRESVNLLGYSGGGTGQFVHLAVSRFDGERLNNFATVLLGDRVDIRALREEDGLIAVDLVQAGPADAACCPGDLVTRRWRLQGDRLFEQPATAPVRLALAALEGSRWTLSRWNFEEAVAESVRISLEIAQGRFVGAAPCNHYFAEAGDGEFPGGVAVGPVGSTRRACPDAAAQAAEDRFLKALGGVTQFSFMAGELVLSFAVAEANGALFFKPEKAQP